MRLKPSKEKEAVIVSEVRGGGALEKTFVDGEKIVISDSPPTSAAELLSGPGSAERLSG